MRRAAERALRRSDDVRHVDEQIDERDVIMLPRTVGRGLKCAAISCRWIHYPRHQSTSTAAESAWTLQCDRVAARVGRFSIREIIRHPC